MSRRLMKSIRYRLLRLLPDRWQHMRWQLASGEPHEAEVRLFGHLCELDGLVLDIGANYGQFALSLFAVNRRLRVESWEPNGELVGALRLVKCLHPRRFRYRIQGAGEREELKTLHVPTSDHYDLSTNASFAPDELDKDYVRARLRACTRGTGYRRKPVSARLSTVDSAGLRPLAVKIDVEGWEAAVLHGMAETLRAAHPLLMIELNNRAQWMDSLYELGYRMFRYRHQPAALLPAARHARALNAFWLHPESPPELLHALDPLLPDPATRWSRVD